MKLNKKMRKYHINRHQYQEWVYPNLGSIYAVENLDIHHYQFQKLKQNNFKNLSSHINSGKIMVLEVKSYPEKGFSTI